MKEVGKNIIKKTVRELFGKARITILDDQPNDIDVIISSPKISFSDENDTKISKVCEYLSSIHPHHKIEGVRVIADSKKPLAENLNLRINLSRLSKI